MNAYFGLSLNTKKSDTKHRKEKALLSIRQRKTILHEIVYSNIQFQFF
jgi:hypothetical protein